MHTLEVSHADVVAGQARVEADQQELAKDVFNRTAGLEERMDEAEGRVAMMASRMLASGRAMTDEYPAADRSSVEHRD